MSEGRGSREQGESVRRWLEERQAERARRAERGPVPAGNPGSSRADGSYDRAYGESSYGAPAAGGIDERAPGAYERPRPEPTWEPTPSPSWDAGEPVPPAPAPRRRRRRFGWGKRIALALLVLIAAVVGLTMYFDSKLHRVDA